jgi:hypothetical protein
MAGIFQFFTDLFFRGVVATGDFFEAYLWHSVLLALVCAAFVYLTLLSMLLSPWYRSDDTRELIDSDSRVKICGAWAVLAVIWFVVGTVGWIYWIGTLPGESWIWPYLRPLSAHGTVLVLLFFVWLALYRSIRGDSQQAQRTLA